MYGLLYCICKLYTGTNFFSIHFNVFCLGKQYSTCLKCLFFFFKKNENSEVHCSHKLYNKYTSVASAVKHIF